MAFYRNFRHIFCGALFALCLVFVSYSSFANCGYNYAGYMYYGGLCYKEPCPEGCVCPGQHFIANNSGQGAFCAGNKNTLNGNQPCEQVTSGTYKDFWRCTPAGESDGYGKDYFYRCPAGFPDSAQASVSHDACHGGGFNFSYNGATHFMYDSTSKELSFNHDVNNVCYYNKTCAPTNTESNGNRVKASDLRQAGYKFTGGWGTSADCSDTGNPTITDATNKNYYACKEICGGGYYATDEMTSNTCGMVAAGYYSSGGTKTATPTSNSDCVDGNTCGLVAAGYYNRGYGINATGGKNLPTNLNPQTYSSGTVAAGYYSTGGGTSKAPTANGKSTNSNQGCVTGQSCGKVSAGYYSTGGAKEETPGSSDCVGTQSDGTTANECGQILAGYFGGDGATSSTGSGSVAAGYYSTGGGTSATPTANANGCVGTGKTCGKVSAGYYSTGGAKEETPGSSDCVGTQSDGITANECGQIPAGYYGGIGATSSTGSGIVAAGYYSTGGGTSETPNEFEDGCVGTRRVRQGIGYKTVENACGKVSAGYYSTGGGTSATPTANGAGDGSNGCISGQSCGVIDAGYYSDGGATSSTGSDEMVDGGYYSTGGGTSATPTGTGNGCVSGQSCGKLDRLHYSTGGAIKSNPTSNADCVGNNDCGKCSVATNDDQTECKDKCGLNGGEYVDENGICKKCPTVQNDLSFGNLYEFLPNTDTNKSKAGCRVKLGANSLCDTSAGKTNITYTWNGSRYERDDGFDPSAIVPNPAKESVVVSQVPSATELKDYCKKCTGTLYKNGECVVCGMGHCVDSDNKCVSCPAGKECNSTEKLFCDSCPSAETNCKIAQYCPVNTFSESGYSGCTACAAGYSTIVGAQLGIGNCSDDGTGCESPSACMLMTPVLCPNGGCKTDIKDGISINEILAYPECNKVWENTDYKTSCRQSSCKCKDIYSSVDYNNNISFLLDIENTRTSLERSMKCISALGKCCKDNSSCNEKATNAARFDNNVTTIKTYQDVVRSVTKNKVSFGRN